MSSVTPQILAILGGRWFDNLGCKESLCCRELGCGPLAHQSEQAILTLLIGVFLRSKKAKYMSWLSSTAFLMFLAVWMALSALPLDCRYIGLLVVCWNWYCLANVENL